jgi:hypothetical protein
MKFSVVFVACMLHVSGVIGRQSPRELGDNFHSIEGARLPRQRDAGRSPNQSQGFWFHLLNGRIFEAWDELMKSKVSELGHRPPPPPPPPPPGN